MNSKANIIRVPKQLASRLTMKGLVQGIGMRPAVARFAQQLSLTGYVGNTHEGVEVHVEGSAADVERFEQELRLHLPAQADVVFCETSPAELSGYEAFEVCGAGSSRMRSPIPTNFSNLNKHSELLSARVPADVVVCEYCLAEIQDATNRRHEYPFTSCTNCGPRYTIIDCMPYERADTSMKEFVMCELCQSEYETAADRRFHAQTNACSDCGPQVWLRDANNQVVARRHDAIQFAASTILNGGIVAMRGLGGYQLLVDATSQTAVENLRNRKGRQGKPLAVMVASVAEANRLTRLDEVEQQILCSPAGPIVIAQARSDSGLAQSVSCGLNTIGVMLPTTPLHWLFLKAVKQPLVCTSGNIDGEPLVFDAEIAFETLNHIVGVWLEHDRPIRRPIDDSVMRVVAGRPVAIRLGRGYAPLSLNLKTDEAMVALSGHQKTSLAISNGVQAVLGPHVGDMGTIAARLRFAQQENDFSTLYGAESRQLVCDQHPEYFTTDWADKQAGDERDSVIKVQHHHAHIAAGMLDYNWLDRQVLGVAFDGTGYGTDGTIWGGEFLLATSAAYERVAHLRPFSLVGGELAIRQPWRVAAALVHDAVGVAAAIGVGFNTGDIERLLRLLQKPALSPMTTSAGRLFDGIAAIVLGIERCQFEGQAAMLLESACDQSAFGRYDLTIDNSQPRQLDWRPLVKQVLFDRDAGVSTGTMAMRFHRGLAAAIVEFCNCYSTLPIVLGGGVFQNKVLVELLAIEFEKTGQPFGLPGLIPPNDGGLAAGQLAIATALLKQRRTRSCV